MGRFYCTLQLGRECRSVKSQELVLRQLQLQQACVNLADSRSSQDGDCASIHEALSLVEETIWVGSSVSHSKPPSSLQPMNAAKVEVPEPSLLSAKRKVAAAS